MYQLAPMKEPQTATRSRDATAPSATSSTPPSCRLRTLPASPSRAASTRLLSRKNTPCTTPRIVKVTRLVFAPSSIVARA